VEYFSCGTGHKEADVVVVMLVSLLSQHRSWRNVNPMFLYVTQDLHQRTES